MRVPNIGWKIVGILVFLGLCALTFTWLYVSAGGSNPLSSKYSVTVRVPDAFQLVPNSDVRRAGVRVGTITDITSTGKTGVMEIEIDDENSKPLHRNAFVRLRTKTLVGENYLELDPGAPPAEEIPDGGQLRRTAGDEAVQIDKIFDTLDGPTRTKVRTLTRAGGEGLRDGGENLNSLFRELEPFVSTGATALGIARKRKREVAEVLEHTGRIMNAIGSREARVRTLATAARSTAESVARRDDHLRAGLDGFPAFLGQARETMTSLAALSGNATPVVNDLAVGFSALEPAVQRLAPAAQDTSRLVNELPPFVKAANPMLDALPGFSKELSPAIRSLDGFLAEANPALQYLEPFSRDIGSFFGNTGAWNTVMTPSGQAGRVFTTFSESSLNNLPPAADKAIEALIQSNVFTKSALNEQENPQPAPGTIGRPGGRQYYEPVERSQGG